MENKKWPKTAQWAFPHAALQLKSFISSVQITVVLAKSKVMTTVDGAVTVHIILAGIFEWIITQSRTGT